jgi:hypothetical protein
VDLAHAERTNKCHSGDSVRSMHYSDCTLTAAVAVAAGATLALYTTASCCLLASICVALLLPLVSDHCYYSLLCSLCRACINGNTHTAVPLHASSTVTINNIIVSHTCTKRTAATATDFCHYRL